MIDEPTLTGDQFFVLCIWCSVKIRRDRLEDSYGACLQCFYRIVGEHLSSQIKTSENQYASER